MTTNLGTWLRAQREERGWSRSDIARRLITAAKESGDHLPGADTLRKSIHRWEAGQVELSDKYRLLYCRVLSIKPAEFGSGPVADDAATVLPAAISPSVTGLPFANRVAYRGNEAPENRQSTVRHEVLMAAHEGSEHASHAEAHGIGDVTLEQLRADLVRLSQEVDTGQPFAVFLDLRRVRERVYRLLERHLWPGEQAELYFCLGVINGLMGLASDYLGYPDSAEELNRSGWTYALAIDHRPLLAQLRLQLSTTAYWRGMTRQSRDLAADGLRYLDAGPAAADLNLKLARAHAALGDADSARKAVKAAHEAREREHHDELLELGGEFAVSLATHHYFAGSVLVDISGAESEAAVEIERAVSLYDAGPQPGETHHFAIKSLASIDLATVRLRSGALDAAAAALQPVFALPSAQRITHISSRIKLVRAELAAPVFRTSAAASSLDEQIEDFTSDSVTAGLHALPGGPA